MAGQIPANINRQVRKGSFDTAVIPMYDNKNEHVYNAILYDNYVNAGRTTMYHNCNVYNHNCHETMMSFTNFDYYSHSEWACIVYIHGGVGQEFKGYYLYQSSQTSDHCGFTPYKYPLEGALYITRNVTIHMVAISKQYGLETCKDIGYNTPKTVYDNYCKDARAYEYYGHNYDTYLTKIIDAIMSYENPDSNSHMATVLDNDNDNTHLVQNQGMSSQGNPELTRVDVTHGNGHSDNKGVVDFNYPDKRIGYLNQAPNDFSFTGPDREPIDINSIDKLLYVADIILGTGVPNYRMARIPIKFGLNVEAWEHHLSDYADKRLLQYIKFGYPLSINNPQELCNKEITNHYSACQYPKQDQEYLDKEKELGALLGPLIILHIVNITVPPY